MQEKSFFSFVWENKITNLIRLSETGGASSDVLRTLQNWPLCKVSGRSETIRRFTVSLMLFDKQRK